MNEDEPDFRTLVGDVEPLRRAERLPGPGRDAASPGQRLRRQAAAQERAADANHLDRAEQIALVDPWATLAWRRDGVQHGVFRNLRLGRYTIDTRLDLHRLSVEQAREAVFRFARDALEYDLRCGLISHGRGEGRQPPALLKSCVNHWLRALDQVLAFHSAERRDGGSGATYVLFRKSPRSSDENRERFGARAE